MRNSEEALLRKVGDSNVVNISEAVDPKETENEWKQKRMHGQYLREKEGIDWDKTWQWIAQGDLKGCTEALICSAQEQALRTNYTRFHIDHTAESPLCRMCGSKGQTMANVVSECGKLTQTECKGRHDGISTGNFVVNVDWKELIAGMNRRRREWWKVKTSRHYGISQSSVIGKLRQEDQALSLLIRRREAEVVIIDVPIPGDDKVKDKELEKLQKYQLLKDEFAKVWRMRKVIVVPVITGALGAVPVKFKKYMKQFGVDVRLKVIQKTALLGTAKILRKVLSL